MINGFRLIALKAKVAVSFYDKFGMEGYDADRTEIGYGNRLLLVEGYKER
jgi:hypothetical protein